MRNFFYHAVLFLVCLASSVTLALAIIYVCSVTPIAVYTTAYMRYPDPPAKELLQPAPHHFWKTCRGSSVIYLLHAYRGPIVWFCEGTELEQ